MRILIVEDEAAAVRRLKKLLGEQLERFEIVGVLDSIEMSVEWFLKNDPPDVVLLDIHLADGSSFEIFEHVKVNCAVIFVTAYDEYALDAFRVNAIDYIMKPVKAKELRRAIQRFESSQLKGQPDELIEKLRASNLVPAKEQRVLVRIGQNIKLVELHNAAYLYSEDKIIFAAMPDGKRYPIDYSLDQLETMLDKRHFFRVNRQYIINLKAIDEMYSYSKSRVKVMLNPRPSSEVIVSTERSSHFKKWLAGKVT
jgi:two-component system response regulator LytT